MTKFRADHLAGGAFIVLGILVFVIGWDLPFGRLSAPGAGMLPKLMAGLMMVIAAGILIGGAHGETLSAIPWSDWSHAALILAIAGLGTFLYPRLGFLLTMSLMVFALVVVVERKRIAAAAAYSIALTLFAYWLFGIALKAPLERGILWF